MKEKLKKIFNKIKDLLFPEFLCFVCNRELEEPKAHICTNCQKELKEIEGNVCLICGEPIPEPNHYCDECKWQTKREFDFARSAYEYNEASKKIVLGLKYNNKKFLVPFMASKMHYVLKKEGAMPDIIIPVPITEKRMRFRGYNQAELLASEIGERSEGKIEVMTDVVERVKERPPQANLNRSERLTNLQGVFGLKSKESLDGKRVVIVDDVYTTGATTNELARTLKKLNPSAIMVLTFAKTPNLEP